MRPGKPDWEESIIRYLKRFPGSTRAEINRALSGPRATKYSAIQRMRETGIIRTTSEGRNANLYLVDASERPTGRL